MKILCVAGDPGGARSVAAVAAQLQATGHQTILLAYGQAISVFQGYGWSCTECNDELVTQAADFLAKESPEACLTGTSINGRDYEKPFRQAASRLNIPTVAVLDFWSNYRGRFATRLPDGPLDALADRIAVMDEVAIHEMVHCGFPAERLKVTGQPAFDELFAPRDMTANRHQIRTAFELRDDETRLVMFASQPFSELRHLPGTAPLPYDELAILDLVISGLRELDPALKTRLWIRPHPRENPEKFRPFLTDDVFVSPQFDRLAAIDASDAILGMSSVFLLEAALSGKPVLSLQPAITDEGPLPLVRLGLGQVITRREQVGEAIRELLVKAGATAHARPAVTTPLNQSGAAGRVAELVIDMARQRQAS